MSVSNGSYVPTSGLVFSIDAANKKSNIKKLNNLIDNSAWQTAGPGTNNLPWPQNGDGMQNQLLYDTDPWGNSSLVLKTTPNNTGANGGWEGCAPGYWVNIDKTQKYRSCVWVRRTSTNSNGTFYHGLHTNGTGDIIQSDGTTNGNPYWACQNIGYLTQNQWYLHVGHIFPYNSIPQVDTNSGYWTASGSYVGNPGCNITGSDPRFPSDATLLRQRVYQYYANSDANSNLQLFWPRIDLCDGTEPSITEILTKGPSQAKDLSSIGGSSVITKATYSSLNNGIFSFNGSGSQYINMSRSDLNGGSFAYGQVTAVAWIYIDPTSTGENNVVTVENAFEFRWMNNGNGTSTLAFASNPWAWIGSGTVTNGVWQMITFRHGASTGDFWSNANLLSSTTISGPISAGSSSYPMLTLMGRTGGYGSPAKGQLASFYLYNRALTNDEIVALFNSQRSRFGV